MKIIALQKNIVSSRSGVGVIHCNGYREGPDGIVYSPAAAQGYIPLERRLYLF